MKQSISKIFKDLNLFILFALTLAIVSFLFIIEQGYSYNKTKILTAQKQMIEKATEIITNSFEELEHLNALQFNAHIAQIHNDINKLITQNKYNYITKYIFPKNLEQSDSQLKKLNLLIQDFDQKSRESFALSKDDSNKLTYMDDINTLKHSIFQSIDSITIQNVTHNHDRFNIFSKIFFLLIFILLIINTWYRKQLWNINNDISILHSNDPQKSAKYVFSQEIDFVLMRMKRKTQISEDPKMMDLETEIYNTKGMYQNYSEKQYIPSKNLSSVTILEIDTFSNSEITFTQQFAEKILKKVAYIISLHEKSTDIIARTGRNQFTLIFSAPTKAQLFSDVDLIRQNISELQLTSPTNQTVTITVTGAFLVKQPKAPLEETIQKAKDLLKNTKHISTNKIFQTLDLANENLQDQA